VNIIKWEYLVIYKIKIKWGSQIVTRRKKHVRKPPVTANG
jgi:hypothetical protein